MEPIKFDSHQRRVSSRGQSQMADEETGRLDVAIGAS